MDVDGYEIGEIAYLRHGGPLWAARDSHDRPVLISFHSSEEGRANEERWRQWATVTSPHVAALLDVVRHEDGRWALVQERVEGEPLGILLADGGVREKIARHRIYQGICEGVEALHRAGLVHGDLSPNNIIITPEQRAVIIDLSDDPTAMAGTEGWSDTHQASQSGDIDAVEKIREALLSAEGRGSIPDPATRLRLHASLPATELRISSHRRDRLRKDPRGSRMAWLRRSREREREQRSRGRRPRLPLSIALVVASLVAGGGAYAVMAADQEASAVESAQQQSHRGAKNAGKFSVQESKTLGELNTEDARGAQPQSDYARGNGVQGSAVTSLENQCEADELASRTSDILRVRDEAFNQVNSGHLEDAVAEELLARDVATIQQMQSEGIVIRGFRTFVEDLVVTACNAHGAQVTLRLRQAEYQRCHVDSCMRMPESEAVEVSLELGGQPLKGVRTL